MAGAYCKFCQQRCFVLRLLPADSKSSAAGGAIHLATCTAGMELDRQVTGYDHTNTVNPHDGRIHPARGGLGPNTLPAPTEHALRVPPAVLDLLEDLKRDVEDRDGGWNGGDTVDALNEWFARWGIDVDKPGGHYLQGFRRDDEEEYEQTCERCGDPFEDDQETALCPDCEANNADRVRL